MIEAVTIRAGAPDQDTGRPMSLKAAVRDFLSNMIENTSRPVAGLVNADGEDRGWQLQQARAARVEWISDRRREGHTLRQIADALGFSVVAVWKISKAADSSPPQNEG